MRINFNSIRTKVVFLVFSFMMISMFSIVNILQNTYESNIKLIAQQDIERSRRLFSDLEKNEIEKMSAVLELILKNNDVAKLFFERDRNKLYLANIPLYIDLKERFGISHWYFLNPEPDQTCFLRMHNPELYGDKVERFTYLNSVKSKTFSSGKEFGRTAFALRVVHPCYYQEQLIGYMELGQDIQYFLNKIKNVTNNEYALFIDKEHMDRLDWQNYKRLRRQRDNWMDYRKVVLIDKTMPVEYLPELAGNAGSIPDEGIVLEKSARGKSIYIKGLFPVHDASGQKTGGVLVFSNVTALYSALVEIVIFVFSVFITVMILLIFMLNKLFFVRLQKIIGTITRVVGGDYHTKISPTCDDEVGKVESLLEQFRKIFVNILKDLDKEK